MNKVWEIQSVCGNIANVRRPTARNKHMSEARRGVGIKLAQSTARLLNIVHITRLHDFSIKLQTKQRFPGMVPLQGSSHNAVSKAIFHAQWMYY